MSPEDREWLEMDIEDSLRLADGEFEIPFYENEEWVRQFGRKPWVNRAFKLENLLSWSLVLRSFLHIAHKSVIYPQFPDILWVWSFINLW